MQLIHLVRIANDVTVSDPESPSLFFAGEYKMDRSDAVKGKTRS